jgi:cytochrome c oxidase cbb3-type subunit 2
MEKQAMASHNVKGHEKIETSNFLMIVLVLLTVIVGGVVEIVPLFFQRSTTQPVPGLKPYTALQVAGRDIYVREGCYNCHSQMIRPFRAETLRYGHYSLAGEFCLRPAVPVGQQAHRARPAARGRQVQR